MNTGTLALSDALPGSPVLSRHRIGPTRPIFHFQTREEATP